MEMEERLMRMRDELSRALCVVCAAVMAASVGWGQVGPTPEEKGKLQDLDDAIDGAIVYAKNRKVYKMVIGVPNNDAQWAETELCDGDYARWSPDGSQIAVGHGGSIYVADAQTGLRTLVLSSAYVVSGTIPPVEFHSSGDEIIFVDSGLKAVDIVTQGLRIVANYHKYDGEPGISLSGKRLAARDGHDLYAVVAEADDDSRKGDQVYTIGCSAAVCPDGARVMNNTFPDAVLGVGFHTHIVLRDWDGSNPVIISADICQPEGEWDNHHWSNHPSYIAAQGEFAKECYVVDVGDLGNPIGTRVTWTGGVIAPDLWVDNMVTVTGKLTPTGTILSDVISGAAVTLADGSTVSVSTHTDHDGEYMILGTNMEIPDGTYDITAQGLSADPLGTVTVTGGVGAADFDVTELDADAGGPDGLPDWWELRHFGDLTTTDGTGDQDTDGKTDYEEYVAGTSPTTAAISPSSDGGGGCVRWNSTGAASLLVCVVAAAALAGRRLAAGTCRV